MVVFDNFMDKESLKEFVDELEAKVKCLEEGETIDVYLSTSGGYPCYLFILVDKLRKYKDNIKIYLLDVMNSCGFDLLWYLKDIDMYMLPSFRTSMSHKMSENTSTNSPTLDIHIEHINKDTQLWASRLANLGISDSDVAKFIKGDDLFFSRYDVLKMFPNIKEYEL